jgi:hypothetical protein
MLLQDDPCKYLSKDIYNVISKLGLCIATSKPLTLLCPDVVEWMTRKDDYSNMILLKFDKK